MKKFLAALLAGILFTAPNFVNAKPAESDENKPKCVLMRFTNDTRYDAVYPSALLSELVMEKLVNTHRFNFNEKENEKPKYVLADLEAQIYNEKIMERKSFNEALQSNDYNNFFEGVAENRAQSIATAEVGQFINPEITRGIGKDNNAKYLIQGTIINLGTGNWLSEDLDFISGAVSNLAQMASSQASGLLGNGLGVLSYIGNVSVTMHGIGVQCDLRIIEAESGEIIWSKRVTGVGESRLINTSFFSFGHSNMTNALYDKAMEKAADKIVAALIDDLDSKVLELK
ncbi:MAG: hypothetical protein IJT73_07220 [Selenomonadaceae bacterium]|nr:hypothetical protein [Selenomonadaceae bacterium]